MEKQEMFRKLQTIEALARLARLGERSSRPELYFAAMTSLMEGDVLIVTNHDPSLIPGRQLELEMISKLEEETGIKIYLAIHNDDPKNLVSSYVFVSGDIKDWEDERAKIANGQFTAIKQEWVK